jgi:hypothetical protein
MPRATDGAALEQVFRFPLIEPTLAARIITTAEQTAMSMGGWPSHRHHRHPTCDLPASYLSDNDLRIELFSLVRKVVIPAVAALYMTPIEQISIQDLFVVKYEEGVSGAQSDLEMHTDASAFSFNALLSDPASFSGGGTVFEILGRTLRPNLGEALVHSGELRHAGAKLTAGRRYILVGFLARNPNAVAIAVNDGTSRKRAWREAAD